MALLLVGAACSSSPPQRGPDAAAPAKARTGDRLAEPPAPARACAAKGAPMRVAKTPARSLGAGVAWDGTVATVAWVEDDGDSQEVLASRVGADSAASEPTRVGGVAAVPPVVATAGAGGTVIVYSDDRERTLEVFARRLGADGSPEGAERRLSDAGRRDPDRGKRIGLDLVTGGAREPALVADGADVLAAWAMPEPPRSQIYLARWPADADAPGDPAKVSSGPSDTWGPALARVAGRVGIAWCAGVPGRYEVMFATREASGATATARRVAETQWGPCAPALAAAGDGFVVGWVGGDERDGKVLAAWIGADGATSPTRELGPIALRMPRTQIDRLLTAAPTSVGVVVVWSSPRDDGTGELEMALVGAGGDVLAPARPLASSTRLPCDPVAIRAGEDVLVAWHDGDPAEGEDVYLSRVSCR